MAIPAVTTQKQRIRALDLIRGWFLIMIIIDHVELYPSGFDFLSGRGRFFASGAEGFFFMSGMLVGFVYRRKLAQGMYFVFKKMWRRATQLYIAGAALTLLFTFLAIKLRDPGVKYGLPSVVHWREIVTQTLTFRYSFGWADFLPRFAILTFMAPFVFYLISRGKWPIVILGSLVAWHFRGTNFIMAWQLIFNVAMVIGFYWNEIRQKIDSWGKPTKLWFKKGVYSLAATTFAFSYSGVYLLSAIEKHPAFFPNWIQHLGWHWSLLNDTIWQYCPKWTLGPGRIAFFMIWFIALYILVERYEKTISKCSYGILELLGKNSLFVYVTHAFIIFGLMVLVPAHTNFYENFAFTLVALASIIFITSIYRSTADVVHVKYGLKPHEFVLWRAKLLVFSAD
jgi:hypothetical protein